MVRPKLHDEALAEELLQQAAAMIAQGGSENLSVRKVSQAAGTSTSAVYSLFGSREALVAAVYERAVRGFAASQQLDPGLNPQEELLILGIRYRAWALDNPNLYPVMFGGKHGTPTDEMRSFSESILKPLFRAVQRAIDSGYLRPGSAQQISLCVWAQVHGYVALELSGLFQPRVVGRLGSDADKAFYNFVLASLGYWVSDLESFRENQLPVDGA